MGCARDFRGLGTFGRWARGTPNACPLRRCPGLQPPGEGSGEGTPGPAVPSRPLDLRSRWRRGGPAGGRARGPRLPRWWRRAGRALQSRKGRGGAGIQGGERRGGDRGEREEPRGPRRLRTGKLVLPKSRHPGVRTPLRSGASLRAGPAAGGACGRATIRERRSGEGHLSPSEAGAPSGAATRRLAAKAAGGPSATRSAGGAEPERPRRQRRRPEPCPRPLAPGGAAGGGGGGGGARRGARAAAQTLYKGASQARRRRRRRADAAKVCCLRRGQGRPPRPPFPGRRAAPGRRGAWSPRCEAAPGRARSGPRAPAASSPRAAANCERGLICIGRRSPLEAGQSARPSANGHALFTSLIAQPHARPAQPPPPAPCAPRPPGRPAPSPPAAPLMPLPRAGPARR